MNCATFLIINTDIEQGGKESVIFLGCQILRNEITTQAHFRVYKMLKSY